MLDCRLAAASKEKRAEKNRSKNPSDDGESEHKTHKSLLISPQECLLCAVCCCGMLDELWLAFFRLSSLEQSSLSCHRFFVLLLVSFQSNFRRISQFLKFHFFFLLHTLLRCRTSLSPVCIVCDGKEEKSTFFSYLSQPLIIREIYSQLFFNTFSRCGVECKAFNGCLVRLPVS